MAAPAVRLTPGEAAYADLPMEYSRYYPTEVWYRRSGFFIGRPTAMMAGMAVGAVEDAIARSRAEAIAAARWRETSMVPTIVTNGRTLCQADGQWLDFHGAVAELHPELHPDLQHWAVHFNFFSAAPLRLRGPWAPWLSVLLAAVLYGSAEGGSNLLAWSP